MRHLWGIYTRQFFSPWPGEAVIPPLFSFLFYCSFLISRLLHGSFCTGRGLDRYKDSFNFLVIPSPSCYRMSIGNIITALGNSMASLNICFWQLGTVTVVCRKLHNFCIDRNTSMPTRRCIGDIRYGDEWAIYDNTREDDIFLYGIFTGDHRHDITSNLECLGVVRPIHAECNSCMS